MTTKQTSNNRRRRLTPEEIRNLYAWIGKRNEAGEVVIEGQRIQMINPRRSLTTASAEVAPKRERLFAVENNGRIVWLQAH